jgi:predicted nucleic acid-binding protein
VTLVADASAVAAALGILEPDGEWARELLQSDDLAGPHMLPAEVTNIIRRAALHGEMSAASAQVAHSELLDLPILLFPFAGVAARVWDLSHNLTSYDAWYVAVAEHLGAPLVTLDRRLATAPGPLCRFIVPRTEDTIETGME